LRRALRGVAPSAAIYLIPLRDLRSPVEGERHGARTSPFAKGDKSRDWTPERDFPKTICSTN